MNRDRKGGYDPRVDDNLETLDILLKLLETYRGPDPILGRDASELPAPLPPAIHRNLSRSSQYPLLAELHDRTALGVAPSAVIGRRARWCVRLRKSTSGSSLEGTVCGLPVLARNSGGAGGDCCHYLRGLAHGVACRPVVQG